MSILHQIPSETKIRSELRRIIFGKRVFCPRCGSTSVKSYEKRYRCRVCRKPFSFTSVTWLKGMKLSLRIFWLILWCWTNKVPVDQAMKLCGVSKPTIRRWYDKFRIHLPSDKLSDVRLSGIIQMDEAYRGKKDKKYSIVGAKQKSEKNKRRKIVLKVIPKSSVDRKDAIEFLSQCVIPGSNLQTDGAAIYKGISNWWKVNHSYERHNRWEFTLTSEIEGLWANLITFIRRMYHHVTIDKVPHLVQEFTARTVYPEWFDNPQSFLEASIKPLTRLVRKPGRPKIKISQIYQEKTILFPFRLLENELIHVPS